MNMRLVGLLGVVRVLRHALLVAIIAMAVDPSCFGVEPAAEPVEIITLRIDYADGVEKCFTQLPWTEAMTVADVMVLASKHPHGIQYTSRGNGETAFLTSIDDLKNEGGSGRNWMFRVNGDMAQKSFATTKLAVGDEVLWRFQSFP